MKKMFVETNGWNAVAYVEENGTEAFVMIGDNELSFDDLDTVKAMDFSALDGCETAEDCKSMIDWGEIWDSTDIIDNDEYIVTEF